MRLSPFREGKAEPVTGFWVEKGCRSPALPPVDQNFGSKSACHNLSSTAGIAMNINLLTEKG
jgi:hypothetical protein